MSKLFFTDLDRTIIFSKRFVDDDTEKLIPVERNGERIISYMTPEAHNLLRIIHKHSAFIPVTARKLDEILRIGFVKDMLPEWMICESGRVIYHKGERLAEWDDIIESNTVSLGESVALAQKLFRQILEEKHDCRVWNINDEMIMAKTDGLPEEAFNDLREREEQFRKYGCILFLQQRKAYLIPSFISKANAVKYLTQKLNLRTTVSAGDADMDAGMFEVTTHSVAPAHHTIQSRLNTVTMSTGLEAGESILEYALEKLALLRNE